MLFSLFLFSVGVIFLHLPLSTIILSQPNAGSLESNKRGHVGAAVSDRAR